MSTCKYCGTDPGWGERNCRGAEERSHCYRLDELSREFWRVKAESGRSPEPNGGLGWVSQQFPEQF